MAGPSWSLFYGSWIYNYMCNQCLSPLKLWVQIPLRRGVLDTPLCDQVCQWLAADRRFSPCTPVSSTNKIDRHDIAEIVFKLLKVVLNTYLLNWMAEYVFVNLLSPPLIKLSWNMQQQKITNHSAFFNEKCLVKFEKKILYFISPKKSDFYFVWKKIRLRGKHRPL